MSVCVNVWFVCIMLSTMNKEILVKLLAPSDPYVQKLLGHSDTSDDEEMTGNEDNRDSPDLSDNVESESSAHEMVTGHSYVIYNISLFMDFVWTPTS